MKKIVVVVKGEKILFKGDNLTAIDSTGRFVEAVNQINKILIIKEGKENIAVFKHWNYWREVRDSDKTVKSKILFRATKSWGPQRQTQFLQTLRACNMLLIPDDLKVIVVNALGEAKIL